MKCSLILLPLGLILGAALVLASLAVARRAQIGRHSWRGTARTNPNGGSPGHPRLA